MLISQFSHQNLRNGRQLTGLLRIWLVTWKDQLQNHLGYDPKLCVGSILDWKSAWVQVLWQCVKYSVHTSKYYIISLKQIGKATLCPDQQGPVRCAGLEMSEETLNYGDKVIASIFSLHGDQNLCWYALWASVGFQLTCLIDFDHLTAQPPLLDHFESGKWRLHAGTSSISWGRFRSREIGGSCRI